MTGSLRQLRPRLRGEILDLPVGRRGQPGEHVAQIGKGIETAAPTAFDDGVDDGAALAGLRVAEEEPVLLADGGGAEGIFDQGVIDLQATILEEDEQRGPLLRIFNRILGVYGTSKVS